MSQDKEMRKKAEKKGLIQRLAEKFGNPNRKKAAKGMEKRKGLRYNYGKKQ